MYFDFCTRNTPSNETSLRLDTIFHILGDSTYHTPHKAITANKFYFVCTVKGTGLIQYDDTSFEVNQGDCIFMQPHKKFSYRCKENIWHFWWFECYSCPPLFLPNQLFNTPATDFKIPLFEQSLLYAKESRWDISESLFEAACGIMHQSLNVRSQSHYTALAHTAEQYIRENIGSVTVTEICDVLQVKERTLRNLFRAVYGQSPKQILSKIRLETAQQLLENTVLPISTIATYLGFSSQFHFSQAFKRHYGIPPMQYRHTNTLQQWKL